MSVSAEEMELRHERARLINVACAEVGVHPRAVAVPHPVWTYEYVVPAVQEEDLHVVKAAWLSALSVYGPERLVACRNPTGCTFHQVGALLAGADPGCER